MSEMPLFVDGLDIKVQGSSSILLIIEFFGLDDEPQMGDVVTGDDVGLFLPGVLFVEDRL